MNFLHKASHCFVCGKSGMGKNVFVMRYINASHHQRVFLFDPELEFVERMKLSESQVAETTEEIYEKAERSRIVAYDPANEFPGENAAAFEYFSDLVFQIARDGLCPQKIQTLLVTDEIQKYVNLAYAPQSFKTILETGRRQMLDTLSISRAPNRVNTSIREEFTELVLFRLDDPNSLKFAADLGVNTDAVSKLSEHEYLYYNVLRGAERSGKLEFRGKESVNSPAVA